MPLDPQAEAILELGRRNASENPSLEQSRAAYSTLPVPLLPVHRVFERSIPGPAGNDIPIRIYTPGEHASYPGLIYYHGGGFVLGNLDSHDHMCRELCSLGNCIIVSVAYRLAPECKFPAAVDDAYSALIWVSEHGSELGIDTARLAVGGDSAGGNLAAVVAQLVRDRKGPTLACQVLFYPSVSFIEEPPSRREYADGYGLTGDALLWFAQSYLRNLEDAFDPRVSPLSAQDFRGLPPSIIVTAEYDVLRDEGKWYADKLATSGVDVMYTCYEGMIHDFVRLASLLDKGKQALRDTADSLKKWL